ncbi:hypothetical protein IQ260_29865 [Leptolyngbya cf. ectocarpi LEGE 11479]|uniref:Uncharacterized protein n=1 Tax=Leptolyngbya cf. ectocarpi LEGE 11479 TaxID=1828722 RepID=A0A929A0L8_LEPEC|nr:hypothetical protein [Leptolyngbya ectocarpi]MBE9070846.1 hypothetical protein [Leptolyngbya cf. ectocarpi LEGE 11479]
MNSLTFDRIFAGLATTAVLAGTVAGFWVLGTPGQQRLIMADQQRLEDLSAIANTLYWRSQEQENYVLPEALAPDDRREDPITREPYGYRKIDDGRYQLCANFATDSDTHKLTNQQNWQHPQGDYCFDLELIQSPPSLY